LNHPELGWGELALPPPAFGRSSSGRAPRARWARYAIGAAALLLGVLIALPAIGADAGAGEGPQSGARRCTCASWHRAAGAAFADAVQSDRVDLRWISDALERLRRARRLCDGGWLRPACEDYQAVIRGAAGGAPEASPTGLCLLAMPDDPRAYAAVPTLEFAE
jgi:hypothetical protein